MKQKTTLHTTMNAINTFFVGFRHISFCGSRIDRSTYKSKGKPRNILAAVNQSSFVMRSNVYGDSALVNAAGGAVARPLHPERNKSAPPRVGFAWGAGRGVRQCGKAFRETQLLPLTGFRD